MRWAAKALRLFFQMVCIGGKVRVLGVRGVGGGVEIEGAGLAGFLMVIYKRGAPS